MRYKTRGYSLVEQLAIVGVMGVLLSTAAPSFTTLLKNNRIVTETHALRAVLSNARSEAQTQRTNVTVCRSSNGAVCSTGDWGAGYIGFTDFDRDGTLDAADGDQMIVSRLVDTKGISTRYSQGNDIVRFDSRGNAIGSSGTFVFCDDRGVQRARGLIVSAIGSLRGAIDDDYYEEEGEEPLSIPVVDNHAGDDVSCAEVG